MTDELFSEEPVALGADFYNRMADIEETKRVTYSDLSDRFYYYGMIVWYMGVALVLVGLLYSFKSEYHDLWSRIVKLQADAASRR